MLRLSASLLVLVVVCAGCGKPDPSQALAPDMASFESLIYPLLLRDCAFNNTCHGNAERFFQVLGPGRMRLNPMVDPSEAAEPAEIQFSYDRTRSMLLSSEGVARSLLLTKPLEAKAGGVGHKGVDHFGRNVYRSAQDPSYLMLLQWAQTSRPGGSVGTIPGTGGMGTGGMGTGGMGTGGMGTAVTGTGGMKGAAGRMGH